MAVWGFWLQAFGALLVVLGLGWTWLWWSQRGVATWFREAWGRAQRWVARLLGRSTSVTIQATSAAFGVSIAEASIRVRPSDDNEDLAVWVAYLEQRLDQAERQTARAQERNAEAISALRGDLESGLADSRAHIERVVEGQREALTRANLSGLWLAAVGGLLTFLGLLMAGPPK